MDDDLPIRDGLVIPGAELWFTASRSGGPGGQHVNKTSSRVTLRWNVDKTAALGDEDRERVMVRLANRLSREGVLRVSSESERSQHRNRLGARERMVELVRGALREERERRPTRTPARAHRQRIEDKRRRSGIKRLRKRPVKDE